MVTKNPSPPVAPLSLPDEFPSPFFGDKKKQHSLEILEDHPHVVCGSEPLIYTPWNGHLVGLLATFAFRIFGCFLSLDSWMYPDPNVGPLCEIQKKALYNDYLWVLVPKTHTKHNKYHGYTVRGTPNCPLILIINVGKDSIHGWNLLCKGNAREKFTSVSSWLFSWYQGLCVGGLGIFLYVEQSWWFPGWWNIWNMKDGPNIYKVGNYFQVPKVLRLTSSYFVWAIYAIARTSRFF